MKYSLTILNLIGFLSLGYTLIYSLLNWNTLTAHEGWGMVGMIGIAVLAFIALFVDYVIQKVTVNMPKKQRMIRRNLYGVIFLILAVTYFYFKN